MTEQEEINEAVQGLKDALSREVDRALARREEDDFYEAQEALREEVLEEVEELKRLKANTDDYSIVLECDITIDSLTESLTEPCQVCGREGVLHLVYDPFGIPWKRVCSEKCEEGAMRMLNPDYVNGPIPEEED